MLRHRFRDRDLIALLIAQRIAFRGQHHTAGVGIPELYFALRQLSVGHGLHHGQQVTLQQGKHHLGLRIAEAAVVLDHLRPVLRDHQAEIQAAAELPSLRLHRADCRQEDRFHALVRHFLRVVRIRRDRAHSAGVGTCVPVSGPLVVHAGNHRLHGRPVREGQDRDLRPFEVFLDHDPVAAFSELLVLHDLPDRAAGFLPGHRHGHALAERQAVRLDHRRDRCGLQVGQRVSGIGEHFIGRRRDAVFLHQVF